MGDVEAFRDGTCVHIRRKQCRDEYRVLATLDIAQARDLADSLTFALAEPRLAVPTDEAIARLHDRLSDVERNVSANRKDIERLLKWKDICLE